MLTNRPNAWGEHVRSNPRTTTTTEVRGRHLPALPKNRPSSFSALSSKLRDKAIGSSSSLRKSSVRLGVSSLREQQPSNRPGVSSTTDEPSSLQLSPPVEETQVVAQMDQEELTASQKLLMEALRVNVPVNAQLSASDLPVNAQLSLSVGRQAGPSLSAQNSRVHTSSLPLNPLLQSDGGDRKRTLKTAWIESVLGEHRNKPCSLEREEEQERFCSEGVPSRAPAANRESNVRKSTENYQRLNLKKKIFVRGKTSGKALRKKVPLTYNSLEKMLDNAVRGVSDDAAPRTMWSVFKSKWQKKFSGRRFACFNCGDEGHFQTACPLAKSDTSTHAATDGLGEL
ncbi:unnamed protein product [Cyprideis torosa]|uniref:Uncharacterized protein n=1 Tax=Cyprideis torosa TaxID=163714 RepID=A0A7R8W6F3_9CRUS|nr:unnamed protein product [Cyprideis torosa]CAG0886474.1 unnamed protein product [Cyprideis torosa]